MTLQEIQDLASHRDVPPWVVKLVGDVIVREREVVANWIMDKGFATGHGDSIVDLLDQLEWQIAEKEREACAKICDDELKQWGIFDSDVGDVSKAIRARGQSNG